MSTSGTKYAGICVWRVFRIEINKNLIKHWAEKPYRALDSKCRNVAKVFNLYITYNLIDNLYTSDIIRYNKPSIKIILNLFGGNYHL